MRQLLRSATIAAVLAAGLAACDGGGGGSDVVVTPPPAPPPPTAPVRFEDQFGTNFGAAFRMAANTDPVNVAAGDLNAVSFTTDPVAVP